MTDLIDVFDGRHDCHFDSTRGCLTWTGEDETVWDKAFVAHAEQRRDIGVYPRRDDGTTKWGCVDIDSGDFSEALEVYGGLKDAEIDCWIEASGSWKNLSKRGYHVWVFCSDWVDATYMRALLVEVVRHAGLPDLTEINPKQTTATTKGVGNCVRLPYGRRSVEHPGYSCMVFSPGGEFRDFSRDEFLDQVVPTPIEMIEAVGKSAVQRQVMRQSVHKALDALRRHEQHVPPFGAESGALRGGQNQRAWKILHGLDRASEGERNLCAFVMACHLKGLGKPLDQARSEMTVAVERSFDGGHDFVGEAISTLERIFST